ncbi:MAG: response regulator transcription factor [Pseudomonadota bacterium]
MAAPVFLTHRAEPIPRWLDAFPDATVMHDRDAQAGQLAAAPVVWLHLAGDAEADRARIRAVRAHAPDTPVVALSNMPDDEQGLAALSAGAAGYCSALTLPAILRQVAGVVGQGGLWVGQQLMQRLMRGLAAQSGPAAPPALRMLSQRERQIAEVAARGATNKEIARAMGITERTVKAHLTAAYDKLGVRDRMQLSLLIHGVEDSTSAPQKISA